MGRRKIREQHSKFFGTKQVLRDLNQAAHSTVHDLDPTTLGIPVGGATDQVLSKASGDDLDIYWQTIGTTTNLDGGSSSSVYGGVTAISGGGA